MTKKTAVKIAKKGKPQTKKTDEPKKNLGAFEVKAKKKVEELLGSLDLTSQEKKLAESKISKEELGGIEWLSEQVDVLSKENEKLKKELNQISSKTSSEERAIQNNVKLFFNEIQLYFKRWGTNEMRIHKNQFNKKMYYLFPFLKK